MKMTSKQRAVLYEDFTKSYNATMTTLYPRYAHIGDDTVKIEYLKWVVEHIIDKLKNRLDRKASIGSKIKREIKKQFLNELPPADIVTPTKEPSVTKDVTDQPFGATSNVDDLDVFANT